MFSCYVRGNDGKDIGQLVTEMQFNYKNVSYKIHSFNVSGDELLDILASNLN